MEDYLHLNKPGFFSNLYVHGHSNMKDTVQKRGSKGKEVKNEDHLLQFCHTGSSSELIDFASEKSNWNFKIFINYWPMILRSGVQMKPILKRPNMA